MKEIKKLSPYEEIVEFEEIEKGRFDCRLVAITNFDNFIVLAETDNGEVKVKIPEENMDNMIRSEINDFIDACI